mgnify:CR=1 FL=1
MVPPVKASVAVAIIARNAEKTMDACLRSLLPFVQQVVVCVDQTTTDETARVAFRAGAKVVLNHQVSWEHECPEHGKVMVQDFARTRQKSFEYLRKDVDWWGWIDADDVFDNGHRLSEFLSGLGDEVDGVWLPYDYSTVAPGAVSTRFTRERFLRVRPGLDWEWIHRVHEVITPKGRPMESLTWALTSDMRMIHQSAGHDTIGSARRNILILEIELEKNPNDQWALFYLGNSLFAVGEWVAAIQAFEASTNNDNVYQVWQTLVYLSMAYEKLGALNEARGAALRAADLIPQHAEPYYRLAALNMIQGDVGRCEWWTKLGDHCTPPPHFVFQNPMDREYNARVTLGQAYANTNQISKARKELERAKAVVAHPDVVKGVDDMIRKEQDALLANSYVQVLMTQPEGILPTSIPDQVWAHGRVRDVLVPSLLKHREGTQPRIIFWCGRSAEPWYPGSPNTTGIGGSETAVIEIAKRFVRDGWLVDVYNEPDKYEGVHDGVGYWGLNRLREGEKANILCSWRNPAAITLPIQRDLSFLWCHDLHFGPGHAGEISRWDRVLGVSAWHGAYLSSVYSLTNTHYVPNGIDSGRFAEPIKKVPFRCVYASAPDRGLTTLLALWPEISRDEPGAELHIGYGWDTIDRYIAAGLDAPRLQELKAQVEEMIKRTPRVVWRGRLPQNELAKLYQESYLWLYPTTFLEVSCISAMEAMAGGAVPVVTSAGALPETIGEGGLLVSGNAYTAAWREFYVHVARAALLAPDVRLPLLARGKQRALELTWDAAYEQWKTLVNESLKEKTGAVSV